MVQVGCNTGFIALLHSNRAPGSQLEVGLLLCVFVVYTKELGCLTLNDVRVVSIFQNELSSFLRFSHTMLFLKWNISVNVLFITLRRCTSLKLALKNQQGEHSFDDSSLASSNRESWQ